MRNFAMLIVSALLTAQMSCTAVSMESPQRPEMAAAPLATPEVAVVRVKQTVLVAWKPVQDADGYMVYRETEDSHGRKLLGIGPKEASGFIDRDPPQAARYTVQAFKASDPSEPQQSRSQKEPTTGSPELPAGPLTAL